ncbi:MAG: hypothetical protein K2H59_00645 [Muribaculaceae bacterium]|nr:hypothetical protein [Muribaculaceae bacterium]
MEEKLTKQMKCAIGEQLVCAHLIAKGWPTVNVNSTIDNFEGIDLLCQKGLDADDVAKVQVKTVFKGVNATISVGMNCGQAADIEYLKNNIKGPWVFVHVKETDPLNADFYILTAQQMIELVYGLHQWYLYGWERRPCTDSLKNSVACVSIAHILGKQDVSKNSDTFFNNPMKGIKTLNEWDNIWK